VRLVVDTSVLVCELLRAQGRERLADDRLDLFLPEQMWDELQTELPRRIAAFGRRRNLDRRLGDDLARRCLEAVEANVVRIDLAVYAAVEDEARERCLRDPSDWPVVACALALGAGVWTADNDFLGTGVPTWTTDTLQAWLRRQPTDSENA
jgi:predicted nucleic acid-binding protein